MSTLLPETDSEDELPPGWEERVTGDGSVYYAEHGSKSTQWTHPRTGKRKRVSPNLPFGWKKTVNPDGTVMYEEFSGRTTSTDPRLAFPVEQSGAIRQRFDGSSTAMHVLHGLDLSGRIAVITGANTGIGYETAKSLAFHGCSVILACRNPNKGSQAVLAIKSERASAQVAFLPLDLTCLKSVREFVTAFTETHQKLHILILNAAVFGIAHSVTVDGFESMFQTNHLGHFYLVKLLQPTLMSSTSARVVVLSSESHRFSYLSLSNISEDRLSCPSASSYVSMLAYNDTKLCSILFSNELNRRLGEKGVRSNAVHPGNMVSSSLPRYYWFYRLLFMLVRPFTKSLQQAAATTVLCAVAPELENVGGLYFNNCCPCKTSAAAQDERLAAKLWNLSEAMLEKGLNREAQRNSSG
ncbi:WW domain-containing oxidoreductase-like [Ornithodoros turicata]|uniref:WW domain-containing oxidoreductase n=1 Tax=Ornithodoros turicata TaxID=34597 RepID=A0A2R5LK64_9ACAR